MSVQLQHSPALKIKQLEKLLLKEEKKMKDRNDNTADKARWRFPGNFRDRQDHDRTYGQFGNPGNSMRDAQQWKRDRNKQRGQDTRQGNRNNR